ncbi:MAG: NAD(P)H-dependent oxidoreductase [Tildeniella torsiva UHER 1998/13D]|nr:NAD(P)H-dependent oxidoreductase [Tildeniella torsiva UHER 1998/13D]
MTHILHLDASPRGDRSISRTLSKEFINQWKTTHPNDAYLDQIVRAGRTFSVDEAGYKELVHNKKMTIIMAQGGAYPEGSPTHAYDLQTPYLKLIFGFIGITDIEFVYADSLNMGDEARELAIANAQSALKAAIAH